MCRSTFVIILLLLRTSGICQDIITKGNGEVIRAKVLEVGTSEVKFKKYDNPDGPTYILSTSDVQLIHFENGTSESFGQTDPAYYTPTEAGADMAFRGKQDALVNYTGRNAGAGWTAAATILLSPVLGVVPAAIGASTRPADKNLNDRDAELMKNNAYYLAYVQQAHSTKRKKLWRTYAISSGVWLILVVAF